MTNTLRSLQDWLFVDPLHADFETAGFQAGYPSIKWPSGAGEQAVSDSLIALVKRCLAGEQPAMHQLVEQYRGQVYGLCYYMLSHRQDAEDATQETFIRVLKSLRNWDQQRDFEPWLLAIAGNRCRTALAARKRRGYAQPIWDTVKDTSGDLQAARNLAEEVNLVLQSLREEYRQAFLLFHQQELNYEQIAATLDRPIGTVKTWIHRARRELIEALSRRGVIRERLNEMRRV